MLKPCALHAAACKTATCAGGSLPQNGNLAPKSGVFVQDAFVTDKSHSCLVPGLNFLVVANDWLGFVYLGL